MTHWTEEFFVTNSHLFVEELRAKDDLTSGEVAALRRLLSETYDHDPSTVLDVGCGLGRHCIEFASDGLDVTGIDISQDYLTEARERAAAAGVADHTTFRELDMRNLTSLDGTFDLVVCLYNTLGYFDDETNVDVLRGMQQRLTESGVCVVQLTNKDAMLSNFQSQSIRERDFGTIVEQLAFDTQTSRMTITRDVLRTDVSPPEYEGRAEYSTRVYSPPELQRLFEDAGFADVTLFGNYDGDSPSLDTGMLVALAR